MEKNQQNKCLSLLYFNDSTAIIGYYGNLYSKNQDVITTKLTSRITLPLREALAFASELTEKGYTFKIY